MPAGQSCAERIGLRAFREDGVFLMRLVICMWVFFIIHCALLMVGHISFGMSKEGSADGDKDLFNPTV